MRDLRFNVWDRVEKKMHYDVLNLSEFMDAPRYEILQFTGRRDKFDRPIFEGDLLEWKSGNDIFIRSYVEYVSNGFWCKNTLGEDFFSYSK